MASRLEDRLRRQLPLYKGIAGQLAVLNVFKSAHSYDPVKAGVPADLTHSMGPIEPVLDRLDPLLRHPIELTPSEFDDLVTFVRYGLLDERAKPENLCKLVPAQVPSGMPVLKFQACK